MSRRRAQTDVAATLAELRGRLGDDDELTGYDAIIDVLSDAVAGRSPLVCLRGARHHGDGVVPCVVAVLDDVICEAWLDGRHVHTAVSERPTIGN